jgi:hypothetical protein
MGVKVANNATSTIVGAVSSSDVGITVTAGTGVLFPALGAGDYFYATLVSAGGTREIVKVTARAADAMTIVRGQEGTTAQSFAAGSRLELRVTAASITDMIAEHDQASEITFVPTGGIAATNVQSAIAELDSEAAKSAALAATGANQGDALIGQSNGLTIRSNSPLTIWRQRPSLVGGAVAGTPAENAARLKSQLALLKAEGGGTLRLVEDVIQIDRPLDIPHGVSIIGPGKNRCMLQNTYAPYNFRQSCILRPGNFHPAFTEDFIGDANTKSLNAVTIGDQAATLVTAGDAAGFVAGDICVFFDPNVFYTDSGGFKHFLYQATRRITKVTGSTLSVDEPFWDSMTAPAVQNLRTTTVVGAKILADGSDTAQPLFVWGDGEISGFSMDTIGYPMADTACYKFTFGDIEVRQGRAIHYGNAFQHGLFDGVGGQFMIACSELSQSSENVVVQNFTVNYDADGAAAQGLAHNVTISEQENGIGVIFQDGMIDLTGAAGGPVLRTINNADTVFRDLQIVHRGVSYTGTVVTVGDAAAGTGRRAATGTVVQRVRWSGPCGYYLNVGLHSRGWFDGTFEGAVVTGAATVTATARNDYAPSLWLDQGIFTLVGAAANQHIVGCYVGGGMTALATGDYAKFAANLVSDVRTSKSIQRAGLCSDVTASVVIGTTETVANSDVLGLNPLHFEDTITVSIRCDITGTAGTKTVYVKLLDTTTPNTYTMLQFNIPSAATGQFWLTGEILVRTLASYFPRGVIGNGAGATTCTESQVAVDLSAKNLTFQISAIKASAGDTFNVQVARFGLSNPVQV